MPKRETPRTPRIYYVQEGTQFMGQVKPFHSYQTYTHYRCDMKTAMVICEQTLHGIIHNMCSIRHACALHSSHRVEHDKSRVNTRTVCEMLANPQQCRQQTDVASFEMFPDGHAMAFDRTDVQPLTPSDWY